MKRTSYGGWAATLKTAMRDGRPVCLQDPRYLDRLRYASELLLRMHVRSPYHEAVRARCRQLGC